MQQLANWAGNHVYRAADAAPPGDADELREIVARAPRVRVLGSRHSFTAIADSGRARRASTPCPPTSSRPRRPAP